MKSLRDKLLCPIEKIVLSVFGIGCWNPNRRTSQCKGLCGQCSGKKIVSSGVGYFAPNPDTKDFL